MHRHLLALTLAVASLSPALARAVCRVERSVSYCREADCTRSAEADFQRYRSQEIECGVQKDAAPFIMKSKLEGEPKGTVVLVHGLSANPLHMTHAADQLAREGYNVVMPILHGHGGSDELLAQANLNTWKADVHFAGSVAEKMQKPLFIMGHSTGGVMAALEASVRPGKYKAIVGMDPALNVQGVKGVAMQAACLAKSLWTFPSEIPKLVGGKDAPTGAATCHEDAVKIGTKQINDIINKYCERGTTVPPTNKEFTLQSLCALASATNEMTQARMAKLPPALMMLSHDAKIFGYIARDKLIASVSASPMNRVEQSASPEHGIMTTNCSEGFEQDMSRTKAWFASHANN